MKEFELIKTEYNERVDFYENDFYKIIVEIYNNKIFSFVVEKKMKNLASIYINEDWKNEKGNEYGIKSVEIQTTSYGSMDIEGIENLIENYKIAVETVKEIKKTFKIEQ